MSLASLSEHILVAPEEKNRIFLHDIIHESFQSSGSMLKIFIAT